jgi:hypothetical protein
MPRLVAAGAVVAPVDGALAALPCCQARSSAELRREWVDLRAPDSCLDPALVGAVVAAIHRVSVTDPRPLDLWSHEPVGADRWDQLVEQLLEAGAPFAVRSRRGCRTKGANLDHRELQAVRTGPSPLGQLSEFGCSGGKEFEYGRGEG